MSKELIIITGAGGGIGKAIAIAFSKKNYSLLLIDRSGRAASLGLPDSISARVDVADPGLFNTAVRDAEARFGPADAIVNNAGVMLLGQLDTQNPSEWQKMLDVNVMGVLNGIRSVLPGMISRKKGTIINISSIAGRKTFPNHAAYCATKFGVHALTENLREEVAKHAIRCMTIAPGVVETGLLGHTTSNEIKDAYSKWKTTMPSVLKPEDVANAVVFAYEQPQHVCIRELVIGPTGQEP
ncbi:MAG: oxidoreductase [Bdellovibrionales bacterium RIFOXYD1_FULL_53_11]|nr:MAG: oxidoreductase [Bdellovibrionales bacterium RIFOXYD1_FULL_53_11]